MSHAGPWQRPLIAEHELLLLDIARRMGVHPDAVRAHDRHKTSAAARHVFWWVLRQTTHLSLPELGSLLGGASPFDHTAVVHACRRIHDAIAAKKWPAEIAIEVLAERAIVHDVRGVDFDATSMLREGEVTTGPGVIASGQCREPSPAKTSSPPFAS